ncbi:hypothetical protein CW714_06170 [Methanophagales archaeon]|nr:MAG: hypothetical protein CW714_06170 [Methanophagales archaeon]
MKFVHRYKEEIELGTMEFSAIAKEFNRYVGVVFEDLAKEFVIKKSFNLPFQFNEHTKQIAFLRLNGTSLNEKKKQRGLLKS